MPLTTARGAISPQTGNVSQILIAEQDNYSDETKVASDVYKFQPRINSADIAQEGTTIETAFFDGSAAQTRDAPGPIDITNGMSIALSGNGTALPLRMLTQDKNPTWNIFGGTGQTIPAQETVVSSTTLGTSSSTNHTVADNLSSTENPVQLNVTLASGRVTGRGVINITGTDNSDNTISETLAFRAGTSASATARSRLWYKTVTAVTSAGFAAGTFTMTARDRSAQVIFTPQDDELVAFWTAEVAKGVVPNLYYGLCMQSATIDITRDALVAFDCTFLGRRGRLYRNFGGDTGASAEKTPFSSLTGKELASADVFGGWQAQLTAENDISIALQELTLTINQELAYTNVLGDQFQPSPPVRGAKRLVQFEATVSYAPENDFSDYFESNQVLSNVQLAFNQTGLGAYPYQLVLEADECQFTADPDPAVADVGQITQTLTFKATRPRTGSEYRFRARYSDYEAVKVYS